MEVEHRLACNATTQHVVGPYIILTAQQSVPATIAAIGMSQVHSGPLDSHPLTPAAESNTKTCQCFCTKQSCITIVMITALHCGSWLLIAIEMHAQDQLLTQNHCQCSQARLTIVDRHPVAVLQALLLRHLRRHIAVDISGRRGGQYGTRQQT